MLSEDHKYSAFNSTQKNILAVCSQIIISVNIEQSNGRKHSSHGKITAIIVENKFTTY